MNNPWMVKGLSVLLCLYLAFGLMGCAKAAPDGPVSDMREVVVYVPIIHSASMKMWTIEGGKHYDKLEDCQKTLVWPGQTYIALWGELPPD
jgi:hypothetical protein